MPRRIVSRSEPSDSPIEPTTTPEGRESKMVNMAYNLAEQRFREGTASAQEVTHFLKLGSSRERLEQERLRHENGLLQAKIVQLENQETMLVLYDKAISAMRTYQGQPPLEIEDGYDDA